ncbi:pharyngeal muscle protein 2-like [Salvia splendens]|uniref:pharyngeal muscle protein 2-like n=1 Tax=Salvia splendens TaxID=180675 RepID=UPI001C27A51E|nr:pharyngeal muscle protein 2-like [Salvia splendens]
MEVDPISAHYDSDSDEREARKSREQGCLQGDDEPEKTPAAGTVSQGTASEEIDLNETANKKGIMTDDEFQAILDGVNQREDDTATMVEDLNLTSRVVEEDEEGRAGEKEPESMNPQIEAGKSDVHVEAEETEARAEIPKPVAPPVTKPKAVKRKLVLKGDPRAEQPKPQRKPEEEKEEDDGEEVRYQVERKRKGKDPMKKKSSNKKPRTVNIGIVITDPAQRTLPHRQEIDDSDYAASEDSDSDSDISLEDEEYSEQQLPHDHRELIRMNLIEWTVRLGMCILDEAIGPEWRSRERGIPGRHMEFEPQEA